MDLSPSQFTARYTIGDIIGEGTFGRVNKAKRTEDGKIFAVKRITLPQDKERRTLILRERENMRKMKHKNVVKCFHFTIIQEMHGGK